MCNQSRNFFKLDFFKICLFKYSNFLFFFFEKCLQENIIETTFFFETVFIR